MLRSKFDVVVAGGGIAGLLSALALSGRGESVLVVEELRVGGRQSLSSHGYIHKGYIFGPAEDALVEELRETEEYWDLLVEDPVSTSSYITFLDEATARSMNETWSRRELFASQVDPPGALDSPCSVFNTGERTVDGARLAAKIINMCVVSGVEFYLGSTVTSYESVHGGVSVRVRGVAGAATDALISARNLVIATGAGSLGRKRSVSGESVAVRRSFLAVVRGNLPKASFVFPGESAYGLFLAPRKTGRSDEIVWLVSDFHSFAPTEGISQGLQTWWERHVARSLRAVFTPECADSIEVLGSVSELKSGFRPVAGTVAATSVSIRSQGKIVVVVPSKLALAPKAAEEVATACLPSGSTGTALLEALRSQQCVNADLPGVEESWYRELVASSVS